MSTTEQDLSWRALYQAGVLSRFAVLCLGVWLHAANSLLAATTLPRAVEEIGGANLVGWAFTLYLLGSILAGSVTGLVVARFDLRTSLFGAAAIYGIGCITCAIAPQMELLLVGRLLQGLGGGGLVALTYVALNQLFPQAYIPRLIALISAVWSASAFCGPLIGGTFATFGLWRFAFWAFAAQTLLFIVILYYTVPQTPRKEEKRAIQIPFGRLIVMTAAVLLVSFASVDFHPIKSPLLCLGSLALFALFLRLDQQNPSSRMFPSRPANINHPVGAGLIFVFCAGLATMSFLVYGPFLLETLYGMNPLMAGYIVALESVSWGAAAVIFSGVSAQKENQLIRLGSVLITLAILGFAIVVPHGPLWAIVLCAICQGAGFGMMWGFLIRRIVQSASEAERDVTSAAVPTTQQIGFATGAALTALIANALGFDENISITTAQTISFWIFAAFVPIALFANLSVWKLSK